MGGRVVCTLDEDLCRFLSYSPEHDLSLSVQGWVISTDPYSSLPSISSSLCLGGNSNAKTEVGSQLSDLHLHPDVLQHLNSAHSELVYDCLPPACSSVSVTAVIMICLCEPSNWSLLSVDQLSRPKDTLFVMFTRSFLSSTPDDSLLLFFFGRLFPCNPSSPWTQPPCLHFPITCVCHWTLFISLLLNLGIKPLPFYVFIFWCICVYLCGDQRRVLGFPFYHSLPYSFETGPLWT